MRWAKKSYFANHSNYSLPTCPAVKTGWAGGAKIETMTPHEERTMARILEICINQKISIASVARLGRAAVAGQVPIKMAALTETIAEYQREFAKNNLTQKKIEDTLSLLKNHYPVLAVSSAVGISPSEVYRIRRGDYKGGPEGGHTELPPLNSKRGRPKKASA